MVRRQSFASTFAAWYCVSCSRCMTSSCIAAVLQGIAWEPPHLSHKDLAPGRFLGVVETPGTEGTKLVASKHRWVSSMHCGTGSDNLTHAKLQFAQPCVECKLPLHRSVLLSLLSLQLEKRFKQPVVAAVP
jgi:hypothetical protein